jgi:hypothetical protein
LRRENGEFGFCHIEPTAVLWRVMPFEPLDETSCLVWWYTGTGDSRLRFRQNIAGGNALGVVLRRNVTRRGRERAS